jgi:hypothetical protein
VLQEIEKQYKDGPLTLLAMDIDAPEDQAKIPAYLKKNGLDCRVVLAGDQGVEGYDFYAASSLFVVDRKGMVAGVPSEFYFNLEEELNHRLPDLLAGAPTPGPMLWSLKKAPAGFGEVWRVLPGSTVSDISIAPATAGKPPEIGILDESHHLRRYSAKGDALGDAALEDEKLWALSGVDLDGDGVNEWIARKDGGFQVLDSSGNTYWAYNTYVPPGGTGFDLGGFVDLDGDGRKEILVRSGDTISALRNVPSPVWKNEALRDVRMLQVDSRGGIRVQSGDSVGRLGPDGKLTGPTFHAPANAVFMGETLPGSSRSLRLFGHRYFARVDVDHDLDGDGKNDILIAEPGGIVVYAQDGSTLLSLFIAENQNHPKVALGNLDGKPGDELLVFIPQYGLVALGMNPPRSAPVLNSGGPNSPAPASGR